MKGKYVIIVSCVLAVIVVGCLNTTPFEVDLKKHIPDVEVFVKQNEQLLNDIHDTLIALSDKNKSLYSLSFSRDKETALSDNHELTEFVYVDCVMTDGQSINGHISETKLFTAEEQELFSKAFATKTSNVSISSISGFSTVQCLFGVSGQSNLRVIYLGNDTRLIDEWRSRTTYFEEVVDDWYLALVFPSGKVY